MNILDSRVVLRLRTVPDILDLAFRYVAGPGERVFLRLTAAVLVPCFAVCVALRYALGWDWVWVWFLAIALGGIAQGAFTVGAGQLLFSDSVRARDVLARFARRLPSYLVALFLTRLAMALGGFLLFVLLVPAWLRAEFVHEASLLEGASPGQAYARSARFIKRQGGPALGLLCSLLLAQFGFVVAAELLGQGLVEFVLQLGQPLGSLWSDGGSVYALAGFFLSVPYVAAARFLKYTDIRTRKEGWDIQLKFTALQAADEAHRRMVA
ncbi:MAG TPA: hypothetical protein VKN99_10850 [Polyangia bacterium]|nr:hypothetical protein [Polyangia bacterium]